MEKIGIVFWLEVSVFSLAIVGLTYLLRAAFEVAFPSLRGKVATTRMQYAWQHLILALMPALFGVLLSFGIKQWSVPFFASSTTARLLLGFVCGFFCSWAYRILKKIIEAKFLVYLPDSEDQK